MKKIIFTLLLIVSTASFATAKGKVTPPQFDGEVTDLFNAWADDQLVRPAELDNPKSTGVVAVDFTVKASGEIDDIEILFATHPEIVDEVKRVVNASKELWTPAQADKSPIDYRIAATIKYPMIKEVDRTLTTAAPLHSDVPQSARATPPFTYRADKMPQYEGEATTALYNYVYGSLTNRKKMKLGVFGRVILRYTITTEDEIDDIEVMVSPDYVLSKSAISILSKANKWTAGKQGKEKVNVRMSIPVDYVLDGATTD